MMNDKNVIAMAFWENTLVNGEGEVGCAADVDVSYVRWDVWCCVFCLSVCSFILKKKQQQVCFINLFLNLHAYTYDFM